MRMSIMCLVYKHIVFAINYLPSMHNTAQIFADLCELNRFDNIAIYPYLLIKNVAHRSCSFFMIFVAINVTIVSFQV